MWIELISEPVLPSSLVNAWVASGLGTLYVGFCHVTSKSHFVGFLAILWVLGVHTCPLLSNVNQSSCNAETGHHEACTIYMCVCKCVCVYVYMCACVYLHLCGWIHIMCTSVNICAIICCLYNYRCLIAIMYLQMYLQIC